MKRFPCVRLLMAKTEWLEDRPRVKGRIRVSLQHHLVRIGLLMSAVAVLLTWLASGTEVMFADGLRYVAQAQKIDQGSWSEAVANAVDHPAYPLAIAAVHRLSNGNDPSSWQAAAQAASTLPECFWSFQFTFSLSSSTDPNSLAGMLADVPGSADRARAGRRTGRGHVLALLDDGMLDGASVSKGRPNGLAGRHHRARGTGLHDPARRFAAGLGTGGHFGIDGLSARLAVSLANCGDARSCFYRRAALDCRSLRRAQGRHRDKARGGRLLGLSARSAAMAVERERPLDPGQSTSITYVIAGRAAVRAVQGAVTSPLLVLAIVSLFAPAGKPNRGRKVLFLCLILIGWLLALVRLHATGGYCTPRHALIFGFPVIAAAAHGLNFLVGRCTARFCNSAAAHRRALFSRP